jgi:hypothetical protein
MTANIHDPATSTALVIETLREDEREPLSGLRLVCGAVDEVGGEAMTSAEEHGLVQYDGDYRWSPTPLGRSVFAALPARAHDDGPDRTDPGYWLDNF